MPRIEGLTREIVLVWSEMKALLDGTAASLEYIEGDDGEGHTEVVAIDGSIAYATLILATVDQAEWDALKPTIKAYLNKSPSVVLDEVDQCLRQSVSGKMSIVAPEPPPNVAQIVIDASTPLELGGAESPNDTVHTIAAGKTFHLQSMKSGAQGDPTEGGSRVDAIYVDSVGVEHLIDRDYISAFTVPVNPNTSIARDGTSMVGNGVDTKIIIRRIRLSNGKLEVDSVAKGFEA